MKKRVIVAITGASGTQYAIELLKILKKSEVEVHLVISDAAKITAGYETQMTISEIEGLAECVYDNRNIGAAIASGSFKTMGMIIVPCSVKTLSEVAYGMCGNLISRAADVCLKERRRLVMMVRETPLHAGHLESMLKVTHMGAIVYPPVPAMYANPETIEQMIQHSVSRILDLFDIENDTIFRWK